MFEIKFGVDVKKNFDYVTVFILFKLPKNVFKITKTTDEQNMV